MSKVETLLKVTNIISENPSATNTQIASDAGISEQYLKGCKSDVRKLSPYFWKLLLKSNEIDFIVSKLNASNGFEKGIIGKLHGVYPVERDGLMRLATSEDKPSSECLDVGICVAKGDRTRVNFWLNYLVYDVLFRVDSDGEMDYRLAESCESLEGYSKWRVKLRDRLCWSDGKPLTHDDIFHTVSNSTIGRIIQNVDRGDKGEIVFILFHDNAFFPQWLFSVPILPSHSPIYEVTNGPFLLKKGRSSTNFHLYRNRNYYRDGHPKIDRINLRTYIRPQFAVKAVDDGKLDVFFPVSLYEVTPQRPSTRAQRLFFEDFGYWMLMINRESDYMKRKNRFRHLQGSIDYSTIDSHLSGTISEKPTKPQTNRNGLRVGYICDMPSLELSNLLKYIVGYLGTPVSYVIDVSSYPPDAIKATTDVIISQPFFGHGYLRLRRYFYSRGESNTFGLSYPEVDALIDKLDITAPIDERKVLGQQIIEKLVKHEAIILLAPASEYLFSILYLEPSPKISTIVDFIVNLSDIVIERGTIRNRKGTGN